MATPTKIGRYEILEELGHGAMGAVYKARDPMMDRTVAVKTVLASALAGPAAEEYRERFLREARAAGRFSHPGIVTVHDVGEYEGTPYLVMEYITGRTLAQELEAGNRFDFDRIYEIGREIAEALGYAHAHGVIHRDIKPANIMMAVPPRGGVARAKVTDFGVAKLTAAQVTVTGQLLGTPSFMPPEQFTGVPLDGRSDLFSLGVILYWMATGDKPFTGDTITAVSYKIVHTDIVPPRKINPAIPAAFEQVILKLLQKDPSMRYATGEALAEDLTALREGRAPKAAEETVVSAQPGGTLPAQLDPDVTQDIHAPSPLATSRSATRPPSAPARAPSPATPATTVAQPPAATGPRWQTPLLLVLVIAVLFLVWRQMSSSSNVAVAPAPGTQSAPLAAAPPGVPPPAAVAETAKQAGGGNTGKDSASRNASTGKAAADASSNPVTAETPPVQGMPDMEKLNRDIQAYVENAMKQAAESQRLAATQRNALLAQALEEKPIPADQSRLVIDAARIPAALHFAVEVDGEVILHRNPQNPEMRQRVPIYGPLLSPGRHIVRVVVVSGNARLPSNSVTGQFEAGGQRILTLQLVGSLRRPRPGEVPGDRSRFIRITLE